VSRSNSRPGDIVRNFQPFGIDPDAAGRRPALLKIGAPGSVSPRLRFCTMGHDGGYETTSCVREVTGAGRAWRVVRFIFPGGY